MAINWGNLGQGAVGGAAIGSSIAPGIGTAVGAGLGALGGGLFGGDDPTQKANRLLSQIPEKLRPYFEPYFQTGKNQLPQLSDVYGGIIKDPGGTFNRIGAGYKESPGYKWKLNQGEQAINNAAAAGGMAGSGEHGQLAGTLAENLANEDFYNYMQQALGLFGTGVAGSQDLAKMGQTAGTEYGLSLGENIGNKANLGIASEYGKNQNTNNLLANLIYYLKSK